MRETSLECEPSRDPSPVGQCRGEARVDPFARLDAVAQADLVRRGEAKPIELVDAAIERIERVNGRLNAVVDPAVRARTGGGERSLPDGRLHRRPVPPEGSRRRTGGDAPHRGLVVPPGLRLRGGQRARRPLPARRARHRRQDQHARVRDPAHHGVAPARAVPEPVGPHADDRRLERRLGGGGGRGRGAGGPRQRRRRIDPHPRVLLRRSSASSPRGRETRWARATATCCRDWSSSTRSRARCATAPRSSTRPRDLPPAIRTARRPLARPFLDEVGADPGRLRIALGAATLDGSPVHPTAWRPRATPRRSARRSATTWSRPSLPSTLAAAHAGVHHAVGVRRRVEHGRLGAAHGPHAGARALRAAHVDARRDGPAARPGPSYLTGPPGPPARGAADGGLLRAARRLADADAGRAAACRSAPSRATPTIRSSACAGPAPSCRSRRSPTSPGSPRCRCRSTGTPTGLPMGAHFVARFGDEATLFRLAAQLEAARPWADRRPAVHAYPTP